MSELEQVAVEAGASDLFVFRRVADDRLVNLDGHGRGAGWAGNIAVEAGAEPFLARTIAEGVARSAAPSPRRLFGPYWTEAAVATVVGEHVVVLAGPGITSLEDDDLHRVAQRAAAAVEEVPVAKRLADQLEVAQAALRVAELRPRDLREAGVRIATIAADVLACDFGALLLVQPPGEVFIGDAGWRPPATADEVATAVMAVRGALGDGPLVEQDLATSPHAHPPLSHADGLVARLTTPIGEDPDDPLALLTVAHAGTAPRGFTSLCEQVAVGVADAAVVVLRHLAG